MQRVGGECLDQGFQRKCFHVDHGPGTEALGGGGSDKGGGEGRGNFLFGSAQGRPWEARSLTGLEPELGGRGDP